MLKARPVLAEKAAMLMQRLNGYSPQPLSVVLELTYRCGLACRICPQVEDRRARPAEASRCCTRGSRT